MMSAPTLGICLVASVVTFGLFGWAATDSDSRRKLPAIVHATPPEEKSPPSSDAASSPSSNGAAHLAVAFRQLDAAAPTEAPAEPLPVPDVDRATPSEPSGSGSATPQTIARSDQKAAPTTAERLSILQIGDSHTSADFFTGEVRRVLQAQFGQGGVGYMPAGRPNGFRSAVLDIEASSGWKYKSLQTRGAVPSEFRFSGYNAIAVKAGETIRIKSDTPIEFDAIEIEALARPDGGAISVQVNGKVEARRELRASATEPALIKVAAPGPGTTMQELLITTEGEGTVFLSSISIYNSRTGLTYNSVGYSGATVNILNKLDPAQFSAALRRINPRIVVLAFGTNESANETLDLASYSERYERVVGVIKTTLPTAVIVIIAPPDFNKISPSCTKPNRANAICREASATKPAGASSAAPTAADTTDAMATTADPATNTRSKAKSVPFCVWHTPTTLDQVRDIQRKIADRHGFIYWNWGSIMPSECGAHEWFKATPRLMSPDHVHFTAVGYRKSADEFLTVLSPIIDRVLAGNDAISHH
jgi:lysophospholipase L1-like esterase